MQSFRIKCFPKKLVTWHSNLLKCFACCRKCPLSISYSTQVMIFDLFFLFRIIWIDITFASCFFENYVTRSIGLIILWNFFRGHLVSWVTSKSKCPNFLRFAGLFFMNVLLNNGMFQTSKLLRFTFILVVLLLSHVQWVARILWNFPGRIPVSLLETHSI